MKVLVKFRADWADEFNVIGFKIYEKSEWEKIKIEFAATNKEFCWYFGTNEGFDDIDKDFIKNYTAKEITDFEYTTIKDCFGDKFGIFCDLKELMEYES